MRNEKHYPALPVEVADQISRFTPYECDECLGVLVANGWRHWYKPARAIEIEGEQP